MKGTENDALYIRVNIIGTFYSESYYKSVSLCNSEGAHASCFLSPLIAVRGNNQTQADQPFSIIYRPSPSARGCSARLLLLPRPRHLIASPVHLIGLLMNLKKKKGRGGHVKVWSKFNSRPGKLSQGFLPLSQPLIHGLTLYIMHSYPTGRVCCLINLHLHLQRKHRCPWEAGVEAPSPSFPVSELKLKRWGGGGGGGGYPVSEFGLQTLRLSCYKV